MKPKILGIFEKVDFPEFNITGVDAKIDSGAFTGALHCTKVIQEETKDGSVIHFSPFDYPKVKISTKNYYISNVKSSNGIKEKRYVIKTSITIQGGTYDILLSLTNRSNMINPVIIGRRFISKHRFLVDVNMSYSKRLIIKRTEKI